MHVDLTKQPVMLLINFNANQINSQISHQMYYNLFDNYVFHSDSPFRRNIVKTKVF